MVRSFFGNPNWKLSFSVSPFFPICRFQPHTKLICALFGFRPLQKCQIWVNWKKLLDIMVLVTQGLKSSFSLKGQLVTNNRKISDARPLILVTSFMHYISCLTRKTKAKKISIMLLSKNGTSWSVFILISLVIRNADSWGRNHSLVFITSEIRVLYQGRIQNFF